MELQKQKISNGVKIQHPIIAGILLFLLNVIFTSLNVYVRIWILDIVMHFLGGITVAWFLLLCFKKEKNRISKFAWPLLLIGGTALVGVLWECYEWVLDRFVFTESVFMGGLDDTLFDLVTDIFGASVVALVSLKKNHEN